MTSFTSSDEAWDKADTPTKSVFHVSQVHKFSKTKRILEVLMDERSVRATQKGKPSKTYSAGAFVNIELTAGAGVTVRIHEKNMKQPKKYVFDTTRNRDRFCNLVRGLQRNQAPPQSWFTHFDRDQDGIISQSDLQIILNDTSDGGKRLCRGQTLETAARVMIDWCEGSRDRPEWIGVDYYEFVRYVVCLAREFTMEQFLTSWSEVALCTSTEITRTRNRAQSVDPRNFLPGEHSWNETTHVSWVFNSENMGLTTIRGVLVCTNYRLIFTAYREDSDKNDSSGAGVGGSKGGSKGENSDNRGSAVAETTTTEDQNLNESKSTAGTNNDGTSGTTAAAANSTDESSSSVKQMRSGSLRTKDRRMGRRRASLIVRDQVKADKYQKEVGRARLMFVDRVMQVPLLTIQSIKQSKRGGSVRLHCKDIREVKFAFDSSPKWVTGFVTMLEAHIFPTTFEGTISIKNSSDSSSGGSSSSSSSQQSETKQKSSDQESEARRKSRKSMVGASQTFIDDGGTYYAACYHRALREKRMDSSSYVTHDGWTLYDPIQEFQRQGVIPKESARSTSSRRPINFMAQKFRLVDNTNYSVSPTYPSRFVVPALFSNSDVERVVAYRSQGRIPALTWRHPSGSCVMCRSSQPLTGIGGKREASDEKLINLYRTCGVIESASDSTDPDRQRFYILDARSWVAATANKIGRGKGAENASHYGANTFMEFCDIPNIHTMRASAKELSKLAQPRGVSDGETKFLSQLEETGWLNHVQSVLTASVRLVEMMDRESTSVLIHCSDGWDRTAQIGAAAQIMMDPYFRTLEGLAVLIEKEWTSFGHKFRDRLGHGMFGFFSVLSVLLVVCFYNCYFFLSKNLINQLELD
jgi:myotubularin-related protein 1/2